jgi:hypothetical protein
MMYSNDERKVMKGRADRRGQVALQGRAGQGISGPKLGPIPQALAGENRVLGLGDAPIFEVSSLCDTGMTI